MAIHRSTGADGLTVTFVLRDEVPAPVSVVGSFNDWTPGTHLLAADPDGTRSVTIVVPAETDVHFRYLGPDGFWFDELEADEITAEGSVLWASAAEVDEEAQPDAVSVPDAVAEPEVVAEPKEPDETGERLETVTDRINEAKDAARDLVDRDVLDEVDRPEEVPARNREEGPTTGEVAE